MSHNLVPGPKYPVLTDMLALLGSSTSRMFSRSLSVQTAQKETSPVCSVAGPFSATSARIPTALVVLSFAILTRLSSHDSMIMLSRSVSVHSYFSPGLIIQRPTRRYSIRGNINCSNGMHCLAASTCLFDTPTNWCPWFIFPFMLISRLGLPNFMGAPDLLWHR